MAFGQSSNVNPDPPLPLERGQSGLIPLGGTATRLGKPR